MQRLKFEQYYRKLTPIEPSGVQLIYYNEKI